MIVVTGAPMKVAFSRLLAATLVAAPWAAVQAAGDAAEGALAFHRHCAACHSLESGEHRIGPSLHGSFGRRAAQAEGYAYSPALRQLKVSWTDDTLDAYLTDAQAFAPGAKMWLKLPDAAARRDVIAFLQSQAARP